MSERKGWQTSEFWLSIAALITATVLTLADKIDGEKWMAVVSLVTGGYALSRGLAKRNTRGASDG